MDNTTTAANTEAAPVWADYIEMIEPERVLPLHGVLDQEKFDALVADMETNGWTGRPILVVNVAGNICALTGSHRIAAAVEALYEIPVVYADADKLVADGFDLDHLNGDEGMYYALESAGDTVSTALMYEDVWQA